MIRRDKKDEEYPGVYLQNLDKTIIRQEMRYFNSLPIDPRKCAQILINIVCLVNQGDKLTTQDLTDMFFATTKLFQCNNVELRRFVYYTIKELRPHAQDAIIVTSSLTKDMIAKEDMLRAAAIRTFCTISDTSMLQGIERYIKPAMFDGNPAVSSAALVSAYHLAPVVPDVVRQWVNEAQELIMSYSAMVSYHALGVVARIRHNDHLALVKLITKLIQNPPRSTYAVCLLIRYAAKLADEDSTGASNVFIDFIHSCLRRKNDIIVYESARALVNLKSTNGVGEALLALQIFCGSSKPILRFAGVRTLANLTTKYPDALYYSRMFLKSIIYDSNHSIATMAITMLLGIESELMIVRLIKQITLLMSEMSDELKIGVIYAIRPLFLKYPRMITPLASFLAGQFQHKGGLQFKTAIVDVLLAIIDDNSQSKEISLGFLCEFIEDCEHTSLSVRIVYSIGERAPYTKKPSRFISYIYKRMLLDSSPIRAAAVTALAKFAAICNELLPDIKVLLRRCYVDDDDEVRDRVIFFSTILECEDPSLINAYITNTPRPNPVLLNHALRCYLMSDNTEPFDISTVPVDQPHEIHNVDRNNTDRLSREEEYIEQLKIIPGIEDIGPIFKICELIYLTEPETEYRVHCIKYIFARHLILQFECLNTLDYQFLEKVRIRLISTMGFKILGEVSCDQLMYDKKGSIFLLLEFPESPLQTLITFGAVLEFIVRDCDPKTGLSKDGLGYEDTYSLEDIEISCDDQFKFSVPTDDWEVSWDSFSTAVEACDTVEFKQKKIGEVALAVCENLGLHKSGIKGDAVKDIRAAGVWREGDRVLLKARLATSQGKVTMQLEVRSTREDIAKLLLFAVG
ncbi:coatomer subunit gamma-like [Achroia grisella]|uniref:coatomer subunit gamma-like n=1 Tax=Achroia grisella TaxID=688607 RepID=UPI0027D2FF0B|nr:coatomer subunit gamma-like [Achroia grisella]